MTVDRVSLVIALILCFEPALAFAGAVPETWVSRWFDAAGRPVITLSTTGEVIAAVPRAPSPEAPRLQLLSIDSDGDISLIASLVEPGLDVRLALTSLAGGDVAVASLSDTGLVVRRVDRTGTILYTTVVPGAVGTSIGLDVRPVLTADAAGNVYLATEGRGDFLTIAIDPGGQVRWSRIHDPSGGGGDAPSSIVFRDGRVTVGGVAATGLAIVQYDFHGAELWGDVEPGLGGILPLDVSFVAAGADGSVVLAGTPESGCGVHEMLAKKYDGQGSSPWTRKVPSQFCDSVVAAAAQIDSNGDVVLVGHGVDGHAGFNRIHVYRYSADGTLIWQDDHDTPGIVDLANDAVLDRFGRVHVVGTTTLAAQSRDIVTVTWDPDGTKRQNSQWSGPGENNDIASGIVIDHAGALTATGEVAVSGSAFLRYDVATPDCNANGILDPIESDCEDDCDADSDACPDDLDCAAGNAEIWAAPGPARRLRADSAGDAIVLEWDPPDAPGGTTLLYDLLGSSSADGFGQGLCIDSAIATTSASDPRSLSVGELVFYLVRAINDCPGAGSMGTGSDGVPRTGVACTGIP